jgi:hypothetical protein
MRIGYIEWTTAPRDNSIIFRKIRILLLLLLLLRTGQPLLVFAILKIDNNGRENAYEEEVLRQMNEQEEILRPPDVKSLAYLLYRVSEECHGVVPSFHKMGIMHRGAMFRFVSICRWRITRSELARWFLARNLGS